MALAAPFSAVPAEVMKVKHRLTGLSWLAEKDHALVTEFDRDRRWRTTTLVDLTKPDESRKVLFDLSINDAYGDPGRPMMVTRPDGVTTILQDGDAIYLVGQGASPEGSRPFLDKLDLKTGAEDPAVPLRGACLRGPARLRRRLAHPHRHRPRVEDGAAQ